jgi:hypothetical protein
VIKVHESVSRPKAPAQLLASDYLACGLQQYREQTKRLFLQTDPDALSSQLARAEVHLEISEAH